MIKKNISPFKPKKFSRLKSNFFNIYTFNAGFKKNSSDLLIIVFKKLVRQSILSTASSTKAAPVIWNNKIKNNLCKVLIVNSGNANAFTGSKGSAQIKAYAKIASKIFNCNLYEIFVSSTGVIGEQLNSDLIISQLEMIKFAKKKNLYDAAKSIMTTDTYAKIALKNIIINKKKIKIYGIAKGSGMIAPNMGTMLSYIFIELDLSKIQLRKILKENISDTFNSISVDGDTSTNDTVMLFSLNDSRKLDLKDKKSFNLVSLAIKDVMLDLAKQIVCDGEGISKLIEVKVSNAKSRIQANTIAFSIAESSLVKTAIYGEDANWGRIIMAIGKTNEKVNLKKLVISIGKNIIVRNSMEAKNINLTKLASYMKNKIIRINVNMGLGSFNKTVWSSDLTHKYISINTDYRS